VATGQIPLVLAGEKPVLTGRVTFDGTAPPEAAIPLDPLCSRTVGQPATTRFFVVSAERGLADTVVSIKEAASRLEALTPAQRESARSALLALAISRKLPAIEQRGCKFVPYVSATIVNGDILVRNRDPVLHTLVADFVVAGNIPRRFDSLPNSRTQTISFAKPEEFLRIKCDLHPWMFAYVSVFDHPFFDVTDTNGVFHVPLPPPGKYVLEAVHRKAGRLAQTVEVRAGESPVVKFVFESK
jgi:hypothetical protein